MPGLEPGHQVYETRVLTLKLHEHVYSSFCFFMSIYFGNKYFIIILGYILNNKDLKFQTNLMKFFVFLSSFLSTA